MARYTGPVCRLCRRERMKLFLKGAKCDTMKCAIERHPYPPGIHGRGRIRESEYLFQLREKQKARRIYGVLEKQFRNLYAEAARDKGITGENLLRMLEQRLDNVVFRANFAASRNQARQFVRHGHVTVNGKRVTIPSYKLRKGDVVNLDNLSSHKSPGAARALHAIGAWFLFLPPYSPDLNPIENAFAKLKALADAKAPSRPASSLRSVE